MRGDQFLMILSSNSNMRYYPENTTTAFTTELSQQVNLTGPWEVALIKIQFLRSFLHMRSIEDFLVFFRLGKQEVVTFRLP